MIESTGDGLVVIISCEYIPCHNWMSFVSWFSIRRNLPDAKPVMLIKRGDPREYLFGWAYRWKPPLLYYSEIDMDVFINKFAEEVIVIEPHTVAVRDYQGDLGPVEAQSDQLSSFVSYSKGCGKFVTSEWIDKSRSPFRDNFTSNELTVNELKVLKIWKESLLFIAP